MQSTPAIRVFEMAYLREHRRARRLMVRPSRHGLYAYPKRKKRWRSQTARTRITARSLSSITVRRLESLIFGEKHADKLVKFACQLYICGKTNPEHIPVAGIQIRGCRLAADLLQQTIHVAVFGFILARNLAEHG